MAKAMDAHGDGFIPTVPVLEFLKKEAGILSRRADNEESEVYTT